MGHFVVATGVSGGTIQINDPGHNISDLSDPLYNNTTYGSRRFGPGDGPVESVGGDVESPAELLITDPAGRRLGVDPRSGAEFNEIPDGVYTHDGFEDLDLPGAPPPVFIEPVKLFFIRNPMHGDYQITVTGTGAGDYLLRIREADTHGNHLSIIATGVAAPGATTTYSVRYDTSAGGLSPIAFLVPVRATASGLVYNRQTRVFSGSVKLTNTSGQSINGPLRMVLTSLTAGVTLVNASGIYLGSPYITINVASLAPGASVQVPVRFLDPSLARVGYSVKTYSGTF